MHSFLDVARQSYNGFIGDVKDLTEQLQTEHEIQLELKYDTSRQFYIKIKSSDMPGNEPLPDAFVNIFRNPKGKFVECQTLDLIKLNQKIKDTHDEIIAMSDASIQELIAAVRTKIYPLFKLSESLALIDLLVAFAHLVTTRQYNQPEVSPSTLALKSASHPIRAMIQKEKYIANDVYATAGHKRFQIITGCNMSGKSTYVRSIALLTIMAQIGSFVPADYASFPLVQQLSARISTDDCIEANVSTFASEMREMAFILRNISSISLVIVDELGRGTSTTDGLAIAIAISEALIQSKAMVFFVTHFRDLPRILSERVGVFNMHMHVDIDPDFSQMRMKYKINKGREERKFYGLALAQLVDLPEQVMEVGVQVSRTLNERNERRGIGVRSLAVAKKRKLAVHMKETLTVAFEGSLAGAQLVDKMERLQNEFLVRLAAIDAEAENVGATDGRARSNEAEQRESTPALEESVLPTSEDVKSDFDYGRGVATSTSWEASMKHESPLFRPKPTEPRIKQEREVFRVPETPLLRRIGNRLDNAIVIEDNGSVDSD